MQTTQATDGVSEPLQHVEVFAALASEWRLQADRSDARQASKRWAQSSPFLGAYTSPGELVAAINHTDHPGRSCELLSQLLVLAANDHVAARAVLQAVLPGLRRVVQRRWATARRSGPWQTEQDLSADAASAAWEAIARHAGQQHHRPAAVIVRHVEGVLRRAHIRWTSEAAAAPLTPDGPEPDQTAMEASLSTEQLAANLITEAAHAGVIHHTDAALLLLVGVAGHTATAASSILGLTDATAARRLRRAREAIRHRTAIDHWWPAP